MKKILLTLIISATIGIVHAQNVTIPDAIFKAVLVGNSAINTNGDTEIQVSEAAAFGGTIFCASLGIYDLTGIEAFTTLTVLNCSSNLITSLDVSQNTALTYLNCAGDGYAQGQITNLDVSLNTALTEFYCFENQLDSLDVSQNSALTTLWCYENQLDSLDVSQNSALTTLWCSNNQLSSLDLSQNTSLGDLNCAFNQLTYLDVTNGNNTNMSNFYANNNPNLFCVDVDDVAWSTNNWTNIGAQTYFSTNCQAPPTTYVPDDNFENYLEANGMGDGIALNDSVFTANINTLTSLDLTNNFSGLNISDLTGIADFTALDTLECYVNQLTTLDVSTNTALTYLNCSNNQLTSLDVSANTALAYLYCSGNLLSNLDVSANTALTYMNCNGNLLSNLDISSNTALTLLWCSANQLTSLDINTNTALATLGCGSNNLTNLDISTNTILTNLSCSNNQLTSLDLSSNPLLSSLGCINNQLTSLDVSINTNLTDLACDGNLLTTLDLSQNTSLTYLSCSSNQLTNLDLRNGNNINISPFGGFNTTNNTNLYCIEVDNVSLATMNFWDFDSWTSFSINCSLSAIDDVTKNKELLKTTDVIGRDTKGAKYEPLFYIYDDGTVEKRIVIE
jgi:Leucine-rich repeat (LRR) protein